MFQPTHAALSGWFIYAPQFASHIHAAQRSKGRDISYWSPKKEYRDENCNMESGIRSATYKRPPRDFPVYDERREPGRLDTYRNMGGFHTWRQVPARCCVPLSRRPQEFAWTLLGGNMGEVGLERRIIG
jgi:hypothetical protein